ncbi:MAG: hypothetical protein MUF72_04610 [Elainella sp. Prado103]|jgi:hypothetical protein|nr:hypothetical protein [Elainella sp. Prado103]
MTSHQELKAQARDRAKTILAQSYAFRQMDESEQMALYRDTVNQEYQQLAEQQGLAEGFASGNLINQKLHTNDDLDKAGDRAGDFMREVDFPQFVEDLLKAVFDANLNVTLEQMKAYQELLKASTASLSQFVQNMQGDTEAIYRLAEQSGDTYSVGFPGDFAGGGGAGGDFGDFGNFGGSGGSGGSGGGDPFAFSLAQVQNPGDPVLIDKRTNQPVDMRSPDIRAKIMDAKLAMAKEHRALLRETLLMGVSRLVVERGTVKAGVVFDIKSSSKRAVTDQAKEKADKISRATGGGGFLGFFGRRSSSSNRKSQLTVTTVKSEAATSLGAQVTGSVEIIFKSDYFKLDNFAQIFDLGQGQIAQNPNLPRQAARPPALPQQPGQPQQFPQQVPQQQFQQVPGQFPQQ